MCGEGEWEGSHGSERRASDPLSQPPRPPALIPGQSWSLCAFNCHQRVLVLRRLELAVPRDGPEGSVPSCGRGWCAAGAPGRPDSGTAAKGGHVQGAPRFIVLNTVGPTERPLNEPAQLGQRPGDSLSAAPPLLPMSPHASPAPRTPGLWCARKPPPRWPPGPACRPCRLMTSTAETSGALSQVLS